MAVFFCVFIPPNRKFSDKRSGIAERPNLAVRLGNFRLAIRQFSVFGLYIIMSYRLSRAAIFVILKKIAAESLEIKIK